MAEPPEPELPKPVVAYAAPYAAANAAAWESEVSADSSIQKKCFITCKQFFCVTVKIFTTVLKFAPLARVFSYLLQYHWYYLLLLLGYWGLLNIKGDTGR